MARNAMQISGRDCKSRTDIVICWTKGGKDVGGTSQAIRMARSFDIPVFNLGDPKVEKLFLSFVSDPDVPFPLP